MNKESTDILVVCRDSRCFEIIRDVICNCEREYHDDPNNDVMLCGSLYTKYFTRFSTLTREITIYNQYGAKDLDQSVPAKSFTRTYCISDLSGLNKHNPIKEFDFIIGIYCFDNLDAYADDLGFLIPVGCDQLNINLEAIIQLRWSMPEVRFYKNYLIPQFFNHTRYYQIKEEIFVISLKVSIVNFIRNTDNKIEIADNYPKALFNVDNYSTQLTKFHQYVDYLNQKNTYYGKRKK
jgi:hypothetical protein